MLFSSLVRRVCSAGCLAGLLIGALAACDTAPGPSDPAGRPPSLSNFSFSPQELNLSNVDPSVIGSGNVSVDFEVQVQAVDLDGSVDRVVFILRPPTRDARPIAFEQLPESSPGVYSLSRQFQLSTGETGNYVLSLYAVDDTGLLSNEVLGTFALINESSPPVIESLNVPDTITRPASGTQSVVFSAQVSDPDGLDNITSVVFWNADNPGATISMFDDGENGGDEIGGDGLYTVTLEISSTNAAGVNRFVFQATDRSGLKSEVVEKDVTIE